MTPGRDGPTAELLSIGSELLAGETVDTNAAFLGEALSSLGVPLTQVTMLPDDPAAIARAVGAGLTSCDLLVITGGLGPTHDDVTREAVATALGEELTLDPALEATLRERFAAFGRMPEANLQQAMRVPSAEALDNPIGSAPGWWIAPPVAHLHRHRRAAVAILPGVPSEMRRMWAEQVVPLVRSALGLRPVASVVLKTFGVGESALAESLGELLTAPGEGITAGIYARDDGVHVRFSTRSDPTPLTALEERARAAIGDAVWGSGDDGLAEVALRAVAQHGVTSVATVESGTQGSLQAILAASAGPPRFAGGILDADPDLAPPAADALIKVWLLSSDAHGRSRVRVEVTGLRLQLARSELRIHGSGVQRLRRAAFAALDHVRRLA